MKSRSGLSSSSASSAVPSSSSPSKISSYGRKAEDKFLKKEILTLDHLDLNQLAPNQIHKLKINILNDALGESVQIPVMVAKGKYEGVTLGIVACLHGNELNGLSTIHQLFKEISPSQLSGTVVAIPVANVPGFLKGQREFNDGKDLNRLMPGKKEGNSSDVYSYRLMEKIVKHFNYLLDLHTASFGRINSLYVKADCTQPMIQQMALLQNPQIIVHDKGEKGTLRGAAVERGIPAITVEIGNPHLFQSDFIKSSLYGVKNIMHSLQMIAASPEGKCREPILCQKSYWMYAKEGGILEVFPELAAKVKRGQMIGRITDIFGETLAELEAPEDAVVVAKSINPLCQEGARVIHLGIER